MSDEPMSSPIPDSPELQMRRHGGKDEAASTLLYLPGLHGDWTLLGPFRNAWSERGNLLEVTYPRRPDWMVEDYAEAIRRAARAWITDAGFWASRFPLRWRGTPCPRPPPEHRPCSRA
jgi:hypothetical protein